MPAKSFSGRRRPLRPARPTAAPAAKEVRINRFLAESGATSRRGGDQAVQEGRVTIDGRPAVLGDVVRPGQAVHLDGQPVVPNEKFYLLFNKPVGVITTTDSRSRDNIMEALHRAGWPTETKRVFPVGRLDVASGGLILMTNDSDVGERLLRKEGGHEKEYLVTVDQPVSPQAVKSWERGGLEVLGQKLLPAKVRLLKPDHFSIAIVQGLNRQIRRMCEEFGYRIVSLKRVRIMDLHLDRLRPGEYRELEGREVKALRQAVGLDQGPIRGQRTAARKRPVQLKPDRLGNPIRRRKR